MLIKEKVVEVTEEFNKYRMPEAKARLISLCKKSFKMEFTGSFCRTCGFYDYFDDYKILLEDAGLKTEIAKIEETAEVLLLNSK